jgi:hypothetical protein
LRRKIKSIIIMEIDFRRLQANHGIQIPIECKEKLIPSMHIGFGNQNSDSSSWKLDPIWTGLMNEIKIRKHVY